MLDSGLVLGPVTGTYYSLFQKDISNIPTFTPSLFNQTRRITRHNIPVTRYKSVRKNGHDWSPVSMPMGALTPNVGIFREQRKKITEAVKILKKQNKPVLEIRGDPFL